MKHQAPNSRSNSKQQAPKPEVPLGGRGLLFLANAGEVFQMVRAGRYTLRRLAGGKFWLENERGEGLETTERRMVRALDRFFEAEF